MQDKGRRESILSRKEWICIKGNKENGSYTIDCIKQKTSWDEEKKKQVEPVFLVEYLMMSSEYENDWEDDTIYEITSLKWRSDECLIGHQKFCSEIQMFKKAKYKTYKDQQWII